MIFILRNKFFFFLIFFILCNYIYKMENIHEHSDIERMLFAKYPTILMHSLALRQLFSYK